MTSSRAYRQLVLLGEPGAVSTSAPEPRVPIASLLEALIARSPAEIRPVVDPALFRPVDIPVLTGERQAPRGADRLGARDRARRDPRATSSPRGGRASASRRRSVVVSARGPAPVTLPPVPDVQVPPVVAVVVSRDPGPWLESVPCAPSPTRTTRTSRSSSSTTRARSRSRRGSRRSSAARSSSTAWSAPSASDLPPTRSPTS